MAEIPEGTVARLPSFDGDGYGFGGELVISFGPRAVKLSHRDYDLAALLSAAPDLLMVAEILLASATVEIPCGLIGIAKSAVRKATRHEHEMDDNVAF